MTRPQNITVATLLAGNSNVCGLVIIIKNLNSINSRRPWPPLLISHLFQHGLFLDSWLQLFLYQGCFGWDKEGTYTFIINNKMKDACLAGVLEESLQIQPLDVDDIVIPSAEVHATTQQSPIHDHLLQTGTTEATLIASASSQMNNPSGNTGSLTDEDICRDFIEHTCGCKKVNGRPCSS